ncbi:MAG: DUF1329 domain-containing protein, partial [Deltaproteobacteria bacterium]|nr:DUF1329 domain-containing protein [Deltaproteobacteria bacterium]
MKMFKKNVKTNLFLVAMVTVFSLSIVSQALAEFKIFQHLKMPEAGFKAEYTKTRGWNDELQQGWEKMLGFNSAQLVALNDPAPEIKPGTVITPENYKSFPNLDKIFPESILQRLRPGAYAPLLKIEVEATRPVYFQKLLVEQTKEQMGKVSLDPETQRLVGYKCGIPFIHPKNGSEAMWAYAAANISFLDEFSFQTINFINFDAEGKLERTIRCNLYWNRYMGRSFSKYDKDYFMEGAPKDKEEGVIEKGAMVVVYPPDLKGFAFVRTRFMDPERSDYFVSYLPGMRRIRILSGSDAQDPIFGTELTWDTWAADWQKISSTIYPNEYEILGQAVILVPSYNPAPSVKIEGPNLYTKWQKRPVYVLEIKSKDPRYYYQKRIMYLDMEYFRPSLEEYYDRKMNLWRIWVDFKYQRPDTSVT